MHHPIKGPFDGRPLIFSLAVAAILLAAANLRGGIVVVGPLVEDIKQGLGLNASVFSMLTTLPLICFGVISAIVPALTRRVTPPILVLGALLVIALGAGLRVVPVLFVILCGTLALGCGIALLNVLIPGLVKGYFPRQTGIMTGLYSVTLSFGAGLGTYLAIPMRDAFADWRAPMLLWALLPLICLLPWLYLLRVHVHTYQPKRTGVPLWKNPLAWAITGYMGLQSTCFYSLATWLPLMLFDAGLDDHYAGTLTSLINLFAIPANLLTPIVAARMRDQRLLVLAIAALAITSLTGLLLAPALAPLLWVGLIGISGGAALSLVLTLFALRSENTTQAMSLSAMAQSVGYLIAATGPFVIGALYDLNKSWLIPLLLLLLLQLAQGSLGVVAGRPGTLTSWGDGKT
ncbi:CynX/NimT family MFS transporter [Microbulbifer thermotolerans]|uniref:CynX/NimT family MFS transporter n=1 Tax=Microbulbifer thermotolerans TaxID=252514 RepID=UPI00224A6184|nr:MFS transporter [Microbulbifer thermotolerans]MCX2835122.1 MFS transporter [Microbulbifer thermotolerans]